MSRLNIGCGDQRPSGWVNADADPIDEAVVPAALGADPLPWPDGTFSVVVAHHVLQYVGYVDLVPALAELRRVLAVDGVLRISVPSLLGAVRAHARGDIDWFPRIVGDETTIDGLFCAYVTWYSTERSVFTPSWLVELCRRAGFDVASPAQHGYSPLGGRRCDQICDQICDLDGRPRESIYAEALRCA